MPDLLEDYPLAKAYGWRAPMHDTGGILYLYPMVRTKKDRLHPTSGEITDYHYNERARPHALNPDDLNPIRFAKNGDPLTSSRVMKKKR